MESDPLPKASYISPINIRDANGSGSEIDNALGPLSPTFGGTYSSHSHGRLSNFSGVSFMSEDFRRLPQEAENLEFQNVESNQISVIRVPSKPEHASEGSRWRKGRAAKELDLDLEKEKELKVEATIPENPGAEIQVNGEVYLLHEDGLFRPVDSCMSVKAHFKGYAVLSNGIFKPLGGSPAAIDASTLYRVTPTNKFSPIEGQEHESRALHRIKSVHQLLMRGTSGHEENMYVYDQYWNGFVRTEEKRRFPPEKAMLKPRDLRGSIHTQDSEELFASADDALRKADSGEEMIDRGRPLSRKRITRSLTLPSKKNLTLRVNESSLPKVPQTPAMFTNPIIRQVLRFDEQLQGSWLNIDTPSQQDPSIPPRIIMDNSKDEDVHTVSAVADTDTYFPPASNVFPGDVVDDLPLDDDFAVQSPHVSPMTTAFRKTIKKISGTEVPATSDLFGSTLQILGNECVLVICLRGCQSSSSPKLARILIPNAVSLEFDDMDLFLKMRDEYDRLRGFWRQWLSLRGVKLIDLVKCNSAQRHVYSTSFRADIFSSEKLFESYMNPCKVMGDHYWVKWVHRLSVNDDNSYALDFVEGWRWEKILVAGLVPITLSISGGILWCFFGPGQEYLVAFVLGILVIILGWSVVGLLAVLSYTV